MGVSNGTKENTDVQWLVARDFNLEGEKDGPDSFAAMPLLEAKEMLFRKVPLGIKKRRECKWEHERSMFVDIEMARLNVRFEDDVVASTHVPEDGCEPGKCRKLKRWLYGMRPTASA